MCSTFQAVLCLLLVYFTVCTSGRKFATQKREFIVTSSKNKSTGSFPYAEKNIILNPNFDDGLSNWTGKGCDIEIHESMADGKIVPHTGKFFASATGRTDTGNGIQQELTGRTQRKLAYEVYALVRIYGNNVTDANVQVTVWLQAADLTEQYIVVTRVTATDSDWVQMQGKFLINGFPTRVVIFLEGPPPGTDILLNSLTVKHAPKTPRSSPVLFQVSDYGVNIVSNSNLNNGTNGWFPNGGTLNVGSGSPVIVPPMAEESLRPQDPQPCSGHYIFATNRTQSWMGPAQVITGKVKLYMTYQISAWIRIGPGSPPVPQIVNVAVIVDGQWFNGGFVEINNADKWHEIAGSFRIEKEPGNVTVYVQGPDAGVDLMVAGLQMFGVNRRARFSFLKQQTDKVRRQDVILKLTGSNPGAKIKVNQIQNSFPFGAALSRSIIDNEDIVAFFLKHFTWSVFENEIKWYYTEPEQGKLNYKDADDLLNFCTIHNVQIRGHCIFWEDPDAVQQWVRDLTNNDDLFSAVQNRLTGLVTRYKGKFKHYDVDNEMLHSSFYKDRLGNNIRRFMYKETNQLDPSPILFVNDFHIEDGGDYLASPEKYIQLILDLQKQGAPVGGIGIQGHIDFPVGSIVHAALDKLAFLGLPIWITELDVSSTNEYIRAEDLEVMLREAFAHPAVDGIMLWGFWELFMSRQNAYLVNAEGDLNAAGVKFVALMDELMTNAEGQVDGNGQFSFRGYQGSYMLEISSDRGKCTKNFVVEKGQDPLIMTIDI